MRIKPKKIAILISIIFVAFMASRMGCPVYHKPVFKGQIVDAETKQPIEGAVVVVTYYKYEIGLGPHGGSAPFDVRETLTNKEGIFLIPSYIALNLFALDYDIELLIFKPGYGRFPWYQKAPPGNAEWDFESFFSGDFGEEKEVELTRNPAIWPPPPITKIRIPFGIVELPKLKTKEEREKSFSIANLPLDFPCEKIKYLVRLLNEEYKNLGYSHRERPDCYEEKK